MITKVTPTSPKPSPTRKTAPAKKIVATPSAPLVKTIIVKPQATLEKPAKIKKQKLLRESFTIPKDEFVVLENLKRHAAALGSPTKKSEMLRAGIKALAAMPDAIFMDALKGIPSIKIGRPSKKD